MGAIISRFAPAPTGFLHLGHVVNALFVWETADRVLLRIEDHDRQRSRPEYEAAIVEDLDWLGFVADDAPVRQSDREDIYLQALDDLRRAGLVYACSCARAARYAGTCRDRGLAERPGLGLRVRLEAGVERFVDLRLGAQEQRPSEQCGDVLIRDREGNWTYQFAVTVDDYRQGITHVIRGVDLLDSTGRQLQLARLLGRREPPQFLHHPLIMKTPTQKLSKSDGATGVRDLRARGWTPAQVVERARELLKEEMVRRPTSHERMTGRPWDASYYDGRAPWDIGGPQPAFVRVASEGGFAGSVLDAGCGTGENALHVASLGLPVMGVDVAETALEIARQKGRDRGIDVEFVSADAFELARLGRKFQTVMDCGLFHTFDEEERPRYVASLASVTERDGTLYVLCFSDEGADIGPHPISQQQVKAAFNAGTGWNIVAIAPDRVHTRFHEHGAPAWFVTVKRI